MSYSITEYENSKYYNVLKEICEGKYYSIKNQHYEFAAHFRDMEKTLMDAVDEDNITKMLKILSPSKNDDIIILDAKEKAIKELRTHLREKKLKRILK